jgi:hypothetical protein
MKTLKLDRREQFGLACSAIALLLVLFLLVYIPAGPRKKYAQSKADLEQLTTQLQLTQALKGEEEQRLLNQEELRKRLEARPQDFDLFSFINAMLRQTSLETRAQVENTHTRRSSANQPMVTVALTGVSTKELVDLFQLIYSSGNLVAVYKVDRLRPAAGDKGLDCNVTLVSLKV